MKNKTKIPQGAKALNEKHFALGETTGHSHSLQGTVGEDFQIFEAGGVRFCELRKESVELKHEEHAPQTLKRTDFPNGIEIKIVSEYDHFLEESRKVVD